MSAPDKPDPARGWLYVEKRLDEEEDERIKGLSDDALRAELRQGATDPETEWSADELLARAEALALAAPKSLPSFRSGERGGPWASSRRPASRCSCSSS